MSNENLTPDPKNADLYRAYYKCCANASQLRVSVTCKTKVSKTAFNRFKKAFDFLFMLSGNRREMDDYKDLVSNTKEWLLEHSRIPTAELTRSGLDLFDDYQKAIIENQLINDK